MPEADKPPASIDYERRTVADARHHDVYESHKLAIGLGLMAPDWGVVTFYRCLAGGRAIIALARCQEVLHPFQAC
jgi:hypothetical protein